MRTSVLVTLFVAAAATSSVCVGQSSGFTFENINRVALTAFPQGTETYDLYVLSNDSGEADIETLQQLLKAAKKQRTKWVVAAESEDVLREALKTVVAAARTSRKIRTELVIVSPLEHDEELAQVGENVGARLKFLMLEPEAK